MPEIRHFAMGTDAQTIADAVKEDGAIILDNVVSAEFIAALREETDSYMEGSNLGFDDFAGFKTTRTGGLMVRSEKCRELIAHQDILTAC
ncbi:MAG: phytanoyl-CoA dioxygenase family protein, partial [Halieaceae bacterium]|nr:phytanoyl-CoA dioxygenase family protein [Halieaceae bacterium]